MPDLEKDIIKNKVGFVVGILLFILFVFVPTGIEEPIKRALAVLLLCAVWWGTEAIPIYVTALLPGILLPLLDILPLQEALNQYAHRIIFLFFGGFLIARAMIKWGLDKRIALIILSKGGKNSNILILYFMIVTAFLSAFISNTATTAMMLPIGMAVLLNIKIKEKANYGRVLMLAIAYAATIGGMATLVGTPPNAIFAGFSETLLGKEITFFEWLKIGLPFSLIMLPLTWQFLLRRYKPEVVKIKEKGAVEKEKIKLGTLKREEKITIFVFLMVASLWITRPFWNIIPFAFVEEMQTKLDDALVAMIGASLLFIIPADIKKWKFTLTWKDVGEIPFGILILFGGGLCLGKGLFESGAAEWIADSMPLSASLHPLFIIFVIVTITSFLTEVASNTAIANMMMPILIAISKNLDISPYTLLIPATLSCSLAFMLPISTPPNAIVYSSGYIRMSDMIRTGFWLHMIGLVVITSVGYFLTGKILDIFPI
jgi:sodium-dependent dicarboxylate transporter 2/3/5